MSLPKNAEINVSEFIKVFMSNEENVAAYPDGWDRFVESIRVWNVKYLHDKNVIN